MVVVQKKDAGSSARTLNSSPFLFRGSIVVLREVSSDNESFIISHSMPLRATAL